jgi:hypothetical protein
LPTIESNCLERKSALIAAIHQSMPDALLDAEQDT